jgi:hypothetical protein
MTGLDVANCYDSIMMGIPEYEKECRMRADISFVKKKVLGISKAE